jgi:sec-independent protein translocase protein TatC
VSKDPTRTTTLMGHLGELRKRLTYIAIAVVVCCIAAFIEKKWVFFVVMRPLKATAIESQKLLVTGPTEAFMTVLKVSVYAGLIVCLPFILYQLWAFIMPALYENEKRSVVPYVAFTTVLFLAGVAFAYFLVLPVGLRFLVGYGGDYFTAMLKAGEYTSFVTLFLLAFGTVFELPLVMMLVAWAGLVDHVKMRKVRKYAILVEAVVAMVLTPSQDPLSMSLMLGPLIILYELGIWLAKITGKRRAKRDELAVLSELEAEAEV